MNSTLIIFLDGVGIGEANPKINPFFKREFKFLKNIFGETPHLKNQFLRKDDKYLFPTDANLGVDGIPQSGTGQTSIFCGINAPKILGRHFGPFPPPSLDKIISETNIFHDFLLKDKKVAFANAYPKIFFDYLRSGKKRISFTTLSCNLAGVKLKKSTDLRKGKALSAEIDNFRWVKKLNYNLPIIKPQTAAKRLFKIASENHFTLFEYFLTDHLGHLRLKDEFEAIVNTLDDFLFFVLKQLPSNISLIICSDHGNFEDLSTKQHTRNPALTITAGVNSKYFSETVSKISEIKKNILKFY